MALSKKSMMLLSEVKGIIKAYDFALSVRQIYYQLVARQIIENRLEHYRVVSRVCVIGRDERWLPEDAFADRLRVVDKPESWDNLGDFMQTVKEAYTKNKWHNQAAYVEIWTEKDALRGVFSPITYYYDVPLMVVRGQVSRTAIYESYNRFRERGKAGKKCNLFYFGDFDPSGLSIFNSLTERLRCYGAYGDRIEFTRAALTKDQIQKYRLPQDPAKKSDPNYKKFVREYGDNVVELDAMPPDALRDLIRASIESKMDGALLAQVQKAEQAERTRLRRIIAGVSIN